MAEDNLDLILNADEFLSKLTQAINGWRKYNDIVATATKVAIKGSGDQEKLTRTIEHLSTSGERLIVTQQKIKGSWEDISAVLKKVTSAAKEAKAAQDALGESPQQVGRAVGYVSKTRRVDPVTVGGTEAEALKVAQAQAKVVDVIKKQKIGISDVARIWKELARGEIVQYDARLTSLQTSIAKLQTAHRGLGTEAKKTSAELEKQRRIAEETALKEENAIKRIIRLDQQRIALLQRKEAVTRSVAAAEKLVTTKYTVGVTSSQAANATDAEKQAFVARTNELRRFIQANRIAVGELKKVWANADTGQLASYGGKLGELQKRILAFKSAQSGLGKNFRDLAEQQDKATKSSTGFLLSWQSIGRLIAVQAIHRAISLITQQIRESIVEAVKLGEAIAEIQTISQNSQQATEVWFNQAKDLSNVFGTDVAGQLEAAYQTLSNQIAEGANVTAFLVEANKLAATTTASVTESVNALSSVINAYGLSASDAEEISGKLFKAVELGRFRLGQVANSLGDVTVVANELGVNIDEVSAALALFTKRGISPSKAMTQLRGLFVKLLKPTEQTKKFIAELGYESGQAAIQAEGLVGFMKLLEQATSGNAAELVKYINRIRGFSGALLLQGKGLEEYKQILDEISNSTRSYGRAQDSVLESSSKRAKQATAVIKNYFLDMGKGIVDSFALTLDVLFDFNEKIDRDRKRLESVNVFAKRAKEERQVYIDAIEDQIKAAQKLAAARIRSANEAFEVIQSTYDRLFKGAKIANDVLIDDLKEGVSVLKSSLDKTVKDMERAHKFVDAIVENERKLVFEWAQEARDVPAKIQAIEERLAASTIKTKKIIQDLDQKGAEELYKERLKYITDLQKLEADAIKENEKNAEKRIEIEQKIIDIRAKASARALEQQQKENEKALERGKQPKRITATLTFTEIQAINKLKKEAKELKDIEVGRVNAREKLNNLTLESLAIEARIRTGLDEQKYKKEAQLKLDEFRLKQVERLSAEFDKFKLDEVVAGGTGGQEGIKAIGNQLDLLNRMDLIFKQLKIDSKAALGIESIEGVRAQLTEAAKFLLNQSKIRTEEEKEVAARKELLETEKKIQAAQERRATAQQTLNAETEKWVDTLNEFIESRLRGDTITKETAKNFIEAIQGADTTKINKLAQNIQARRDSGLVASSSLTVNIADQIGLTADVLYNLQLMAAERDKAVKAEQALKPELEKQNKLLEQAQEESKKWQSEIDKLNFKFKKTNEEVETIEQSLQRVLEIAKGLSSSVAIPQLDKLKDQIPLSNFARGKVMLGSDNILGLHSANEAIMNAGATRRFYSQLVAMNATPQALQTPGTTIGSLNISMQSTGRLQYDALALGKEIKKLAARKLI